MDPDEKHIMNEEARREATELLVPTGKSICCENCQRPTDKDQEVDLNDYIMLLGLWTKVIRTYCLDCLDEVTNDRNKVRRDENKNKHLYPIRNVSEMTKELVKAFEWKLYNAAADKITPHRRVKHI